MADWYQDKVVLITGASSGIGREAAMQAARRGARLVLVARSQDVLAEVTRELGSGSGSGQTLVAPADVTQQDQVQGAVNQALERFQRIDVAISNAGVEYLGPADTLSVDEIHTMMNTNFFGFVYLVQAVIPVMRRQASGTLAYVSSPMSRLAFPWSGGYAAAKAAGDAYALALAHELAGTPIHVARVYPGGTETGISRHATPDRIPAWYQHAKISPADAARGLLDAVAAGRSSRVLVGNVRMLMTAQRFAPGLSDRIISRVAAAGKPAQS